MPALKTCGLLALSVLVMPLMPLPAADGDLIRVRYNHPSLTVDLGVGLWAWPMPMDYDGDGDLDLVVSSGGLPYEGTYFFENTDGSARPVFKPGRRIADYKTNVQLSPDGTVMTPGVAYPEFRTSGFANPVPVGLETEDVYVTDGRIRANQWKRVDYDGDGVLDLVVGIGDWTDYGWDNAYDADGRWMNGPLHGYVYWARGTSDGYAPAERLMAAGQPIDVYGMPSPSFADFDGDDDLDLICGEFLDGFTYFENVGSRTAPAYRAGVRLPIHMDLQMITPVAVDWDRDGDPDLIVGDEDGRVAFVENRGGARFAAPVYFLQEAEYVKFGALITPVAYDWDGDGDEDIVAGNTAGYIGFIENLDGGDPPRWAAPVYLDAAGQRIRIQAGPNGSIQGPAEAKWGYTALSVADWDADGLADLVVNSILGRVVWYRNVGTRQAPRLAAAAPLVLLDAGAAARVNPSWNWYQPRDDELITQWRTTPLVVDWDGRDRLDLLMLDGEGYLALYEGGPLTAPPAVRAPRRVFVAEPQAEFDGRNASTDKGPGLLRLNPNAGGGSGRRKLSIVDWDDDGRPDLLVNSRSVDWFRNMGTRDGQTLLQWQGPLTDEVLAGHTTSPTTVDWDHDGVRDLLIGAEDGFLYFLRNPRTDPALQR